MTIPFSVPLTFTRYAAGSRDALGYYTEGATTNPAITGNVQPMTPRFMTQAQKLIDQAGLRHTDGLVICRTNQQVYTERKAAVTRADVLTHEGEDYEIKAASYMPGPQAHWVSIAQLIDEKTE